MPLVQEHLADYPSVTAASQVVAKQLGLGKETVRRWEVQGRRRRRGPPWDDQ